MLFLLMAGPQASAQFLDAEIIAAENIDADMRGKIIELIGPASEKLASGVPKEVSAGRNTLITPLRDVSASSAFKTAYSELLEAKIKPAAGHESVLVRINAMIVIGWMTDEASKAMIMAGLEDENVAVRRKAMEALRRRVRQYLLLPPNNPAAQKGITEAIEAVEKQMQQDPPPHQVVAGVAMRILLDINTRETQIAVAGVLNDRVALHVAEPGLAAEAERLAIQVVANAIANRPPFNKKAGAPVARAAYRYAVLAADQLATGRLDIDEAAEAKATVIQCLQALSILTGAAGKTAPANYAEAGNWLTAGDWVSLKSLLNEDWSLILRAEPFALTDEQLETK